MSELDQHSSNNEAWAYGLIGLHGNGVVSQSNLANFKAAVQVKQISNETTCVDIISKS